jgi:DNA-binding XRE family transcriptional regulator
MDDMPNIDSVRIRKLREERGWTQEHLAAVAAVSLRTIQRVESDGAASLETRAALAAVFGLTPLSLIASSTSAPTMRSISGPFPGRDLGIVCGIGFTAVGLIYGVCGATGYDAVYGKLGAWMGLACSVAGILAGSYWRSGNGNPDRSTGD